MRFDDLHGERSYGKWSAYGQSKLANLLFSYELQRRLAAKRARDDQRRVPPGLRRHEPAVRGPAHAGLALLERGLELDEPRASRRAPRWARCRRCMRRPRPSVQGGDYFGPGGFAEMWGPPRKVASSAGARTTRPRGEALGGVRGATGMRFDALKV